MRALWATDIHLEFAEAPVRDAFLAKLRDAAADCILLGGDIHPAKGLEDCLERIAAAAGRPTYFVLGNHDCYGSSIAAARAAAERACARDPRLHWLVRAGVVGLSATTALVGHDGWADGRLGDYGRSQLELNDYYVIRDFQGLGKRERLALLRRLGDEAAGHFRRVLTEALALHPRVIALTHVPPFREICLHEGAVSDDDGLPHFSCKAVGDVMIDAMREHPRRELLVLCGHTHSAGEARILPNLRALAGGAAYGEPAVQRVFEW